MPIRYSQFWTPHLVLVPSISDSFFKPSFLAWQFLKLLNTTFRKLSLFSDPEINTLVASWIALLVFNDRLSETAVRSCSEK